MKKFLSIRRNPVQPIIRAGFSLVGLSVLLLIPFRMNAQIYHPIVQTGATWNEHTAEYDAFSNTSEYNGTILCLANDTVIGTYTYKLIGANSTYYFFAAQFPDPFIGENYSFTLPGYIFGALREDSSHKVWFRKFGAYFSCNLLGEMPSDTDVLLYDFALQPGDTFKTLSLYPSVLDSISTITLSNGETRKYYDFDNNVWIESIGSADGLFVFANLLFFECSEVLDCYSVNGELLYENIANFLTSCNEVFTSINDPHQFNRFEVFPNPAADFLTIDFSSLNTSPAQLKITNVLGQVLMIDEIESGKQLKIPAEKFYGSNIIFCELWEEGVMIDVKKVLIQK